ncbi:MAG: type II secretion system protein GspF [Acidithiobacillales bacterium SG8_45]|jgi:general secretion pathway protein F|nr:MAG: type II secretion system protein GspF [Acidithiobacillales bacterium SG8_45]
MGAFEYQALDSNGRTVKGILEGDAERQVRSTLREKGLTPLHVDAIVDRGSKQSQHFSWQRGMSKSELAILTRQFATLISAGLTIEECLNALIEQSESARSRSMIAGVRAKVLEGQSLATAMGSFPSAFPSIYRSMVDAGEQSGQLDGVLDRLADFTENRQNLQQEVLLAFIYPALVVLVAFLAVTGLMIYVVPQVARVFLNTGQELPWLTSALIGLSDLVRVGGIYALVALLLAFVAFRLMLRQQEIRYRWHQLLLELPVVGRLIRGVNSARITSTLGILTSSGIPLLNALQSARDIPGNLPMRSAMESAYKAVREGGSLSQSLKRSGLFPPVVIHLIASGESTGKLDTMLDRASATQERELGNRVRALTAVLEPLLLLVAGAIIFMIVLAILLPIFEMNRLII